MNWFDGNNLPWLIPLPPLLAFFLIWLVTGRSKVLSNVIAIGAVLLSWFLSLSMVLHAISFRDLGMLERGVFGSSVNWLVNGTEGASGALSMGVLVDPLTVMMLFMVPLVSLLIFIYSLGYMAHDPRNARFFAYLSLFVGAMLVLVVADNLLLLFIGWEVMGLCSYLLIGFWYDRSPAQEIDGVAPYQAGMKAFMTTRVADVILLLGIAYLWAATGTLNFRDIFFNPETLEQLASTPALGGFLGLSAAGLIGICIVTGTVGKSSQFPLHVWLPDAMKGPTPVSAMIHAAAMVSAGVYLIIRTFPVLSAGAEIEAGLLSAPLTYMAVIGSVTALFAAVVAVGQNDIKKVLAYSTISQLGFMVAVLGIGGFAAAAFHLITHAFFKGLLFMGSGSVIHAMEHGHHVAHGHATPAHAEAAATHGEVEATHAADAAHAPDAHGHEQAAADHPPAFDPQDMRNMGGLWRRMPVTTATFVIGGMALAGLPLLTAGFWSKDEILAEALAATSHTPIGLLVLIALALSAMLTAFYTTRQIAMTFMGLPRTEAALHASHYDPARGDGPDERNISVALTAPLIVLAFFAVVAGFVGVNPSFPVVGPLLSGLGIEKPFIAFVQRTLLEPPHLPDFNILAVLLSFTVFLVGVGAAYVYYIRRPVVLGRPDPVEGLIGADAYRAVVNKFYLDELYQRYLVRPFRWFADRVVSEVVDRGIIDGILNGFAVLARRLGDIFKEFNRVVIDGVGDGVPEAIVDAARGLRPVQTGHIQQYMLFALVAAVVIGLNLAIIAIFPQAITALLIVQGGIALVLALFFGASRPAAPREPRPGETPVGDSSSD